MSLLDSPQTEPAPEAPVTTPCATCGAPMEPEQDWCLACGTARTGRLGDRPGLRTAVIAAAATLLLAIGAISAGYAALTDDAGKDAGSPAAGDATPVAGVNPDVAPPAVAQVGPTGVPAGPTGALPSLPTTSTPTTSIPKLPSGKVPTLPSLPTIPQTSVPKATNPPATTTSGTSTTPTTPTTSTPTTSTGKTPTAPPAIAPITLGSDVADLYDPYGRQIDKGDPANAYDPNAKDPWFVTTAADGKPMNVGLLIDLETRKTVRQVEFRTTTPGFRVEVYTTDGSALPPDILDTRWTHVTDRSKVDENTKGTNRKGDGKEIVRFPGKGELARQLVLWFTVAPDAGPTVKLSDLVVSG